MSRLRPARDDGGYGHISRVDGDARLLDSDLQESFFASLCARYDLKSDGVLSPRGAIEEEQAQAHEQAQTQTHQQLAAEMARLCMSAASSPDGLPPPTAEDLDKASESLSLRHSACLGELRKLREAIIGANRKDDFAVRVFETSAEYAILCGQEESYLPALRHLLFDLYKARDTAATTGEARRRSKVDPRRATLIEAYLLHLLCCINDKQTFLRDKAFLLPPADVPATSEDDVGTDVQRDRTPSERIFSALIRNNDVLWRRARRAAPKLLHRLIDGSRARTDFMLLRRLEAAYMQFPVATLVESLGSYAADAAEIRQWPCENGIYIIKRPRRAQARPPVAQA